MSRISQISWITWKMNWPWHTQQMPVINATASLVFNSPLNVMSLVLLPNNSGPNGHSGDSRDRKDVKFCKWVKFGQGHMRDLDANCLVNHNAQIEN